jgi:hypothetical protein
VERHPNYWKGRGERKMQMFDSRDKVEDSGDESEGTPENRGDLERSEQGFFEQEGFVTDAMPEVDASSELLRTQKEEKTRNRQDRIKSGSLD